MAVIGIDLGTTYSAAARCINGRPEIINLDGESILPSVISLQAGGKIAVGKVAKRNQAKDPQNTLVEVKRLMGKTIKGGDRETEKPVTAKLGEKVFSPQELSAMILKKIKELAEADLGEEVTGAVISCPAYFKDPARDATREAGVLAGLNVLRIVNEPTAAAYAYGVRQTDDTSEKLYVVYDLGGGTFDVTVLKMIGGSIEVIGTGGDPELGGGNFDDRIVNWMLEHLERTHPKYIAALNDERRKAVRLRLKSFAEEGKKRLCDSKVDYQFTIAQVDDFDGKPVGFNENLSMETFERLINDLMVNSFASVQEALTVPKQKNYTEAHITAILLVGGSTRVPLVRRMVEERFPGTPVWGQERGINPDEIVALGASLIAAENDPESDAIPQTAGVVDVTGHTLSVTAMNAQTRKLELVPIIHKDTQIPFNAAHRFSSMGNFQKQCRVEVYQGEGKDLDKDLMIGEFVIEIDPIKSETPLRIGLDLDANGLLLAHATNEVTGTQVKCGINYSGSAKLEPAELERRKKALEAQMNAAIPLAANPLGDGPKTAPQAAWAPQRAAATVNPPPSPGPEGAAPPPLPAVTWHVSLNGQSQGPYSTQDVQRLIASKQIASSTLVWSMGLPAWLPAGQVPDLSGAFSTAPPPLPQ